MNRWIILLSLVAALAANSHSDEIDVSDHGVVPGEDATFALNQLIHSLQGRSNVTLKFPKGRYDFYPENGFEIRRSVANHDNSLKRIALPLIGLKNFTVDGDDSSFVFHGRISPIVVESCENVLIKNLSIDWERSFHDELPVVESNPDKKWFVVEVDPDRYPHSIKHGSLFSNKYDWQDRMGSNIVFDPKTRAPIFDTKKYSINFSRPHKATKAGDGRIRIDATVAKSTPPVGSVLVSYGTHPTSRLCPAIHLSNSTNVAVKNVTIYDAGGMGVIAERTKDINIDRLTVTSTKERLVSTRADATHFVGCQGQLRLENCLFEHMLDDGINVHGAYVKAVDYLGNRNFLCEISHFQQWGLKFAEAGDKIALLSRETVLPFYSTEVIRSKVLNERRFVLTVADLPPQLPDRPLSIENLSWYPDVVMRKNKIRENRARGALITTKGNVIIEDNFFSPQMHGILIEGDNNKWYESGGVRNVLIRNNVFENVGFGGGERYPLYASPLLTADQRTGDGQYHRNIKFVDNTIKSFNGHLVYAHSVQDLEVSGNQLIKSEFYPVVKDFPAIQLKYCDRVMIRANSVSDFDRALSIVSSPDCSNTKFENNVGLNHPVQTNNTRSSD